MMNAGDSGTARSRLTAGGAGAADVVCARLDPADINNSAAAATREWRRIRSAFPLRERDAFFDLGSVFRPEVTLHFERRRDAAARGDLAHFVLDKELFA